MTEKQLEVMINRIYSNCVRLDQHQDFNQYVQLLQEVHGRVLPCRYNLSIESVNQPQTHPKYKLP